MFFREYIVGRITKGCTIITTNAYDQKRRTVRPSPRTSRESLEKLNGMVEQILSMSMENRDRLSLRIESTELSPLLESVAAQTRLSAGKPCQIAVRII